MICSIQSVGDSKPYHLFSPVHIYTISYLQHKNFIFILSELFDNYTEISYLCD